MGLVMTAPHDPEVFLTFIVLVDIVAIVGAERQVGQLLHRVFPQILHGYGFEGLPAYTHQHVGAVEQGLHAVDLQREQASPVRKN